MENGSVADAIARLESIAAYADGAGPSRHLVNADFVTAAHAQGLAVHPWTVNETTEMERLLAAGVDGLFTDRPDVLHALR